MPLAVNQQLPRVTKPKRARSDPVWNRIAHGDVSSNLA